MRLYFVFSFLSVFVKDGMLCFGYFLDVDFINCLGGEMFLMLLCFGSIYELSFDIEEIVFKFCRMGVIFLDFVWKVNLLERIIVKCINFV